jgi:gliding motility-associated lipoprotein GldH
MTRYFLKGILFFLIALAAVSCTYQDIYEKNLPVKSGDWRSNDVLKFPYESHDTTTVCNVFINLRHTGLYPYNNIFMFVTTQAPNGNTHQDTIEFLLAQPSGKWLGSGIGDIYDLRLAYKRNIKFGQIGEYTFQVRQAMRDEVLKHITDVGIRIEKAK